MSWPKCVSMEELALPLICQVAAWAKERCSPLPSLLYTYDKQETWLWGHNIRRAIPAPNYCSSWESESSTSLEQHGKASPGCGGCREAGLKGMSVKDLTLTLVCWVVPLARERALPLPFLFTILGRWESWP